MIYSPGTPQASCALAHTGSSLAATTALPVLPAPPLSLIFFAHCHYCLHHLFLPVPKPPETPSLDTFWSLTRALGCCRPVSFRRPISPITGDTFLIAITAVLIDRRAFLIWSSCCQSSTASASTGLGRDFDLVIYTIGLSISLHYLVILLFYSLLPYLVIFHYLLWKISENWMCLSPFKLF
ncbi:hypothetical protein ACOSQ4_019831 [Xanthoceras sorbifolium]